MTNTAATYTTEAASEWGNGTGANGTGRRARVAGFYVVDGRSGRRVNCFTGPNAEAQATKWASRLEEALAAGHIR